MGRSLIPGHGWIGQRRCGVGCRRTWDSNPTLCAVCTLRYTQGTLPTDSSFTGQIQDPSGLQYFNARYYDPYVGQFTSADWVQRPNRYGYVGRNPTTAIDPSGQCGFSGGNTPCINGGSNLPCHAVWTYGECNNDNPGPANPALDQALAQANCNGLCFLSVGLTFAMAMMAPAYAIAQAAQIMNAPVPVQAALGMIAGASGEELVGSGLQAVATATSPGVTSTQVVGALANVISYAMPLPSPILSFSAPQPTAPAPGSDSSNTANAQQILDRMNSGVQGSLNGGETEGRIYATSLNDAYAAGQAYLDAADVHLGNVDTRGFTNGAERSIEGSLQQPLAARDLRLDSMLVMNQRISIFNVAWQIQVPVLGCQPSPDPSTYTFTINKREGGQPYG